MSFSSVFRPRVFGLTLAAGLFWSIGTLCALAQSEEHPYARFVSVSDPVEGRVHVMLQLTTPDSGTFLRIRDVVAGPAGIDVLLEFEVLDIVSTPAVQVRRQPLTIDQLPAGTFPLRILNVDDPDTVVDEVLMQVPEQTRFRHPLPVKVWPPEPGLLDDIWLLLEPPGFCDSLESQTFFPTAERVSVMRSPAPCPVDGSQPRLSAVRLGLSPPQDSLKQLFVPTSDTGSSEDLIGTFRLKVADRLSAGVAGHWSSEMRPTENIELRIGSDGQLELFWKAFSRLSGPARIEADGSSDGLVATFDASIFVSRRLPPESGGFDIVQEPWGSIEIEFTSCDLAVMSWESDFPGFGSNATMIEKTNPGGNIGCSSSPPESARIPSWYRGPGTYFRLPATERQPETP